jgi:hypothetical protein
MRERAKTGERILRSSGVAASSSASVTVRRKRYPRRQPPRRIRSARAPSGSPAGRFQRDASQRARKPAADPAQTAPLAHAGAPRGRNQPPTVPAAWLR